MLERYEGCLLGLALGDALGACFEGGFAARSLWRVLGLTRPGVLRYTDDTQMMIELASSLIAAGQVDADDLAARWVSVARWTRGYGRGTLRVLRAIRRGQRPQDAADHVFPGGSYGNGGAMRVAPIGLLYADAAERSAAAAASCRVTHSHPLAVAGARLIADAVHLVLRGDESEAPLGIQSAAPGFSVLLDQRLELHASEPGPREIARALGNAMTALGSCVTALYCYERFTARTFGEMTTFICQMGGDTDTIAAMAGAIYGARHGVSALPAHELDRLEDRDRISDLAKHLVTLTVAH